MSDQALTDYEIETISALTQISRKEWNHVANPDEHAYNPFVSYDFLEALEASGSVAAEKGWAPCHVVLRHNNKLIGALPLYFKGHSQGEYIFDHAWADAYERAGGRYYPKLLSAVPFTPVPGPRILTANDQSATLLANAAVQVASRYDVSTLHFNFLTRSQSQICESSGFLTRIGQQFHFTNQGYSSFNDFLETLSSRKRKNLRKERLAVSEGVDSIEWFSGDQINEEHLDHFWTFYQDTGARKWGTSYLTREFFHLLVERMPDKVLLMMAKCGGEYIAGALNMIGGDTLYGRYWGCTTYIPNLHFELCYYQAIDYAIEHKLQYVEAGAQGDHKLARGYEPVPTYSSHWIRDEGFRQAVARYLETERDHVEGDIEYLKNFVPYRKDQSK